MLDFLPQNLKDAIKNLNGNYIYEIRLRVNCPTKLNYNGIYQYLGAFGLTDYPANAIFCTEEDINDTVFRAGDYSVYSVEEQLKQGFLTAKSGERIGIAGEYVFENGKPHALRGFTSLCIRVPHQIKGCALQIYLQCMSDRVRDLLLISPPGMGKTTLLRDLSRILSEKTSKNILICDERGEIAIGDFGQTCDVVRYCDKKNAFTAGIRAMRPEIIVTDELSFADLEALQKAKNAGVTVIASAHYSDFRYVAQPFKEIFEKIVVLDNKRIGGVRAIYDGNQ